MLPFLRQGSPPAPPSYLQRPDARLCDRAPLLGGVDAERPHRALLDAVIVRQAKLVAQWLLVGFIHGVMNTDNMSIAGTLQRL
jgi:hypothetical protein